MTKQIANSMYYKNQEYFLHDFSPFSQFSLITPEQVGLKPKYIFSTACSRSYVYEARILDNNQVFLTKLTIWGSRLTPLQDVIPNVDSYGEFGVYGNLRIPITSTGKVTGMEVIRGENQAPRTNRSNVLEFTFQGGFLSAVESKQPDQTPTLETLIEKFFETKFPKTK